MKKSLQKLIKWSVAIGAVTAACVAGGAPGGHGTLTVYAAMDLETCAPVSGISVALNNYYARTANPEKGLAETVRQAASDTIIVNDGLTNSAAVKLVASVIPKEEEIVTDNGVTFGTVTGTNNLRLREEPNSDGRTLTLLTQGEHYVITGQEGDFFKVQIDDDLEGYVFKDYIDTTIRYDNEILSPEEKAAREAESARLKREAEEAMRRLEEAKAESRAAEESQTGESIKAKETGNEKIKETTRAAETVKAKETEKAKETARAAETVKAKETTKAAETVKAKETTVSEETVKARDNAKTQNRTETVEAPPQGDEASASSGTSDSDKRAVEVEDIDDNIREVEAYEAEDENTDEEDSSDDEEETTKKAEKETVKLSPESSGPGGPGAVTSATRSALVAFAKQYLGGSYVYGGTDLENGVDCSGFTSQVYKNFGYSIGRSSRDQAAKGREITLSQAQPGDLLFYDSDGYINHVAMYIGNGQVIHASSSTTGIIISNAQYRTPCKICSFLD